MRVVLADLKSDRGFVNKDTVVGGYGSRLDPFSRVTRIYYYQWRVPYTLAWARAHHARLSWDSGVLRPDCSIRPAFGVIARAMGKNPSRAPRYKRDHAGNCVSLAPLPPVAPAAASAPGSTPTPVTSTGGGAAAP